MTSMTILSDNIQAVTSSTLAATLLKDDLTGLDHEENWVLYLNSANKPLGKMMMTCGTLTSTIIDKRRIVKQALLCDASAIIMYHNHPSENPHPSTQDIRETEAIRECCNLFEISLLDHIIITSRSFFSFADSTIKSF